MTRDQAKAALTNAGFTLEYDTRWDAFPDPFTKVESQTPAAEAQRVKGTEVSIRIAASL